MPPPGSFRRALPLGFALLTVTTVPAVGQEPTPPADSIPGAPGDTVAPGDTLPVPQGDPRITWLGDTLPPADTLRPRFSTLPEIHPDSLVDPYTVRRPGAWPAWVLTGDQLLGRGAFGLLDVLETEFPVLGDDLGGAGVPMFLGTPHGSWNDVQVVIDGIPAGNPLSANWDLRQIPVEAIARVAWYPGPQVAAWGGAGTGGVLEIVTRRSLAPTARSMLAFSIGSFDAQGFSGNFARPVTDRGDLFLAANFDDTEGFLRRGEFTRNQLFGKLEWRLWDRHTVEVSRRSDGLSGDADRENVVGDQDQDATLVHLFYRGGFGPLEARARWYREKHDTGINYDFMDLPGMSGTGERTGWKVDLSAPVGPVVGWVGAAGEEAEATSNHPVFLGPGGVNLLEGPGEGVEGPRLVNPRERRELAGGVGYGRPADRVAANFALRRTDHGEAADDGTSWQLEAVGRLHEQVTVRAAVGRAEAPASPIGQATLVLLADADGEIHPGRPAAPERLARWTGWRGEVRWTRPGWRVAGRLFGATGNDAFVWAPPSAWLYFDPAVFPPGQEPFTAFNVVDLSVSGFEAELVAPLPARFQARLTFRRLEAVEESTDRAVPNVPENQALGQLRWVRRFLPNRDLLVEARLAGRYVGERPTVDGELLPDYLVADALVQATIINFTIYLAYKNAAETIHRSEEAFFLPGREGFFGVVWRFRN